MSEPTGWRCPNCQTIYAPAITSCEPCSQHPRLPRQAARVHLATPHFAGSGAGGAMPAIEDGRPSLMDGDPPGIKRQVG